MVAMTLSLGCGPMIDLHDELGASEDGASSTTEPEPTTTGSPPLPPDEPTTGADGTGLEPDGGAGGSCDAFAQDCPRGYKCTPWANDGGIALNDTRCVPVVDDPDAVGEPCTVEGNPNSGLDTCALGALCNEVSETNEGTCVALCSGSPQAPACEGEPMLCTVSPIGTWGQCIIGCDPLQQDCPEGEACRPSDDIFTCGADTSGDMGAPGDPCLAAFQCDPGGFCAHGQFVPNCDEGNCCSSFCDLTDPAPPCLPGQVCVSWDDDGMGVAGYETVGVCVLPS